MRLAELDNLLLRTGGMKLNLIDHRRHAGELQQRFEMVVHEIAHAQRSNRPVGVELFHRPPRLPVEFRPVLLMSRRNRPMNQQQVEKVHLEPFERVRDRRQRRLVSLMIVPDLSSQKDVFTIQPGTTNPFCNGRFVRVDFRRIDVPIPASKRVFDSFRADFVVRRTKRTQPDAWNFHAVG